MDIVFCVTSRALRTPRVARGANQALDELRRGLGASIVDVDQKVPDLPSRTGRFGRQQLSDPSGALDLHNLPADDEEAITLLTQVKGIGRWSAEIYLLFAEGRPDIWPAGDLAVQIDVGAIMGLAERPGEKQVREIGEAWRPHRGAAAVFAWHHYKTPGI